MVEFASHEAFEALAVRDAAVMDVERRIHQALRFVPPLE
jgi:hypothetical protein